LYRGIMVSLQRVTKAWDKGVINGVAQVMMRLNPSRIH